MKKFENKVICCDVDGTLISDEFELPTENLKAIEYFRSEGGIFTIATGRTLQGLKRYTNDLRLDYPLVCQNGGAIYDYTKNSFLWTEALPKSAAEVINFVHGVYPEIGVEIITTHNAYCIYENAGTRKHESDEHFKFVLSDIASLQGDWLKIVFAGSEKETDAVQALLQKSEYYDKYQMVRSFYSYYEFVNKNTNKARAVTELSKILGINIENFVTIGDNENDCKMLSMPCRSFAPSSAAEVAKKCADTVLKSSNNDGILKEVINILEEEL